MRAKRLSILLLSWVLLLPMAAHAVVYMVWLVDWNIHNVLLFESSIDVANQFDPSQYIVWPGGFTADTIEGPCPRIPLLLGAASFQELQAVIDNVAPTADAGGPYKSYANATITLTADGSTDSDNDIVSYAWDLDNDGQYDDASGATPEFSASSNGTYTVRVQVADEHNAKDTDATTVTVSTFTINSLSLQNGILLLSWQSLTGYTYTVLYASCLTNQWQPVASTEDMPGTGIPMFFTNSSAIPCFYKLLTSEQR